MSRRAPSTTGAVARFLLGSLLALAVVVVGGFLALRSIATREAERDTRDLAEVDGRLVQAAGLSDGVLRGERDEIAFLDALVRRQILRGSVVRVKLWSRDGRILYSDERALVGERFALGPDELAILDRGGAEAELSDLSRPENRFERRHGKLLEAYTAIRTPGGAPVLFEIYRRFDAVAADADRLVRALAPPLLGALLVLLLFQAPLAWTLARRLQRGAQERERLLHAAIAAGERERARIAADLHDGVVQDLAGVAFGLAPLADRAAPDDEPVLRGAIERLRQGVRELRTLLVAIHPPRLASAGLEVALSDLLSPLAGAGLQTRLDVAPGARRPSPHDALVYRVAREALRNVERHAGAMGVSVALDGDGAHRRLVVADDGRGFAPDERSRRAAEGHLGLSLLEDVAREAGARLVVSAAPGEGTRVQLEVPAA